MSSARKLPTCPDCKARLKDHPSMKCPIALEAKVKKLVFLENRPRNRALQEQLAENDHEIQELIQNQLRCVSSLEDGESSLMTGAQPLPIPPPTGTHGAQIDELKSMILSMGDGFRKGIKEMEERSLKEVHDIKQLLANSDPAPMISALEERLMGNITDVLQNQPHMPDPVAHTRFPDTSDDSFTFFDDPSSDVERGVPIHDGGTNALSSTPVRQGVRRVKRTPLVDNNTPHLFPSNPDRDDPARTSKDSPIKEHSPSSIPSTSKAGIKRRSDSVDTSLFMAAGEDSIFILKLADEAHVTMFVIPKEDVDEAEAMAVSLGFFTHTTMKDDVDDQQALILLGRDETAVEAFLQRFGKDDKDPPSPEQVNNLVMNAATLKAIACAVVFGVVFGETLTFYLFWRYATWRL